MAVLPVSFLDKHDVVDLIVHDHKVQATNKELISSEPVYKLIHCVMSSTPINKFMKSTCMDMYIRVVQSYTQIHVHRHVYGITDGY